ncbi:hypothetical protein [Gordonia sp. NPDC058843]|uniref:hypothetical protein n=1 Tax=Gordonia TaxID=2053 RepID=UPI0036A1E792
MDFMPSGPPALTAPRLGDQIARDAVVASDPVFGPSSGLSVGVAPVRIDGRYPLVWVKLATTPDTRRG